MPPCLGPISLAEQFRLLFRLPRARVGLAVALGLTLLHPTATGAPPPEPVDVLAIGQCPVEENAPAVAMVDMSADGGVSRALPSEMPPEWRRAPCPPSPTRRTVKGRCFSLLAEKPPCVDGYEAGGECLAPMFAAKVIPNTIGQ